MLLSAGKPTSCVINGALKRCRGACGSPAGLGFGATSLGLGNGGGIKTNPSDCLVSFKQTVLLWFSCEVQHPVKTTRCFGNALTPLPAASRYGALRLAEFRTVGGGGACDDSSRAPCLRGSPARSQRAPGADRPPLFSFVREAKGSHFSGNWKPLITASKKDQSKLAAL